MKTKEQYIAPQLTVVKFKMERGFASSSPVLNEMLFWETGESEQVETYSEHNVWTENGDFWN
jgi:hypothetical protein